MAGKSFQVPKLQHMQSRKGKHAVFCLKNTDSSALLSRGPVKINLHFKKIHLWKQIQADTLTMTQKQRLVLETFDLKG